MDLRDVKIWTIDLYDGPNDDSNHECRIVVVWQAASADDIFSMFVDVCDLVGIDPDDFPVPNKSWRVRSIGSPSLPRVNNNYIVATHHGPVS